MVIVPQIYLNSIQEGQSMMWYYGILHCKSLPHENYGDWELQGPGGKIYTIYRNGL